MRRGGLTAGGTRDLERIACDALRAGKRLELRYHGFARSVEVHTVGRTRDGAVIMRCWQVEGGSAGGDSTGWKIMRLSEVTEAKIGPHPSRAPRDDYNPDDPAMKGRIVCRV